MTRPLGLHQITVPEADPLDFVRMAADCGYDAVSLFTCSPVRSLSGRAASLSFPTVVAESRRVLAKCIDDHGLEVGGAEFFPITAQVDFDEYAAGLALGRELGAKRAVTHVIDTERQRSVEALGRLCELAAGHDLDVAIEFCPLTPGCTTIGEGAWYVDQVGNPRLGLGVDPLHLTRSGGTAADVAGLDARYISYAQICDGHGREPSSDYFDETHNRELPGRGDFLLHDILSALPASTPIEVEIPCDRRQEAGQPAQEFARQAYSVSRPLVDSLQPAR